MKVLTVTTSLTGGAGIAALRSHKALQDNGIESRVLYLGNYSPDPSIGYICPHKLNHFKLGLGLLGIGVKHTAWNWKVCRFNQGEGFELFTSAKSDYDVSEHPWVKEADVVHLHWVAGFVDIPSFFKKVQKKIIWTLHDMNPFLGGFHYSEDIERCSSKMNRLNYNMACIKAAAYENCKDLSLICPSQWILNESRQSLSFKNRPHFLVRNTLDMDIFKHVDQGLARDALGLPREMMIFLFVCADLQIARKGFEKIVQSFSKIKYSNILLCTIGSPYVGSLSFPHIHFGSITQERLVPIIYSAADAFIITTSQDNLPNVMLESMACGIPIVTTPVGGLKEVVDRTIGIQSKGLEIADVVNAIDEFSERKNEFNSETIRHQAEKLFNSKQHAESLMDIYHAPKV